MAARDTEVESTLAIVGREADAVADRIRHLRRVAGCAVEPAPPRRLRDVYFDRHGELRRAGLALRVRFPDAADPVLGLKGPARHLEGGGVERRERERRWGEGAWPAVAEELERAGLSLPSPASRPEEDPLAALRAAGYRVVQDRATLRRPARLVRDGEAVAELALDAVRFRVAGRELVHREVEVEALGEGGAGAELVGAAAAALLERFGSVLRRWDHSKLATGRALEALVGGGEDLPVGDQGELLPEAYDRLEPWLEAEEAGREPDGGG